MVSWYACPHAPGGIQPVIGPNPSTAVTAEATVLFAAAERPLPVCLNDTCSRRRDKNILTGSIPMCPDILRHRFSDWIWGLVQGSPLPSTIAKNQLGNTPKAQLPRRLVSFSPWQG